MEKSECGLERNSKFQKKKKRKIMEKPEKFKCSKSTGVDDLHPRVWKEMKCEIAEIWVYAIRDHTKSHWNQRKDSPYFSENWIRPSQINSEKQWLLTRRCSSPFQVRCGKHSGVRKAVSVGSARSGTTQTVWKALCNYRAPSRPVQCSSAGAGPVILGMTCDTLSIKPNPATHTAW